eukprot:m.853119 g.853119  ORF g.853119 m.853119 type:complete len:932 (+) comp23499_c0_seq1:35-2830(+)
MLVVGLQLGVAVLISVWCLGDLHNSNVDMPPDWADAVNASDMLIRYPTTPLDARLRPTIGNGAIATLVGSDSVYMAGVYNLNGTFEPYRARLPGLAAMSPVLPNACGVPSPEKRIRCGSPPYEPNDGCTTAQGCCYSPFSPDPKSLPWCYAASNTSSNCKNKCFAEQSTPTPNANEWADIEGLDMRRAAFFQVKQLNASSDCSIRIEQRTYAHRNQTSLLITDFILDAAACGTLHVDGSDFFNENNRQLELQVSAGRGADPTEPYVQDFNWSYVSTQNVVEYSSHRVQYSSNMSVFAGTTWECEKSGRRINVAFATLAPLTGRINLTVLPGKRTVYSFPTVFINDVDEEAPLELTTLVATALDILKKLILTDPDVVFANHISAVAADDDSSRAVLEVQGNTGLARIVNATLYSLRASLAPDVEWSTSPGGLSTGGRFTADGTDTEPWKQGYAEGGSSYYGHVFWDADVWILPAMLPQHPNIARSMIAYRWRTMSAAQANAHAEGNNGTKWAWESAFSGVTATGGDCQEIHLQAGIGMALRAYFRQTHNHTWLERTAWPMLGNITAFFRTRVTHGTHSSWECVRFNASENRAISTCEATGTNPAACQQQTCLRVPRHVWTDGKNEDFHGCGNCWCCVNKTVAQSLSDAVCPPGRLCLDHVESPNEYASGINNDIYTNTAFAAVLRWTSVVAGILGKANPNQYAMLADQLEIPFNAALQRHEEYSGAPKDLRIKQATMTMVPYPVEFPMPEQVQRHDLVYEAAHIGTEGPAMTHSMLTIDWLQMQNKSAGDAEFVASYENNIVGPFLQWMECPLPPDFCQGHRPATNFLTGAGGFIQAVINGYGGLRFNDDTMTIAPTLALNTTRMAIHALSYRNAILHVAWNSANVTVECVEDGVSAHLCASVSGGEQHSLSPIIAVSFPIGETITIAPCPH